MLGLNKYPVTPEEIMMLIETFSSIVEKMERPSDTDLDRLKLFLMEHGEEETKKLFRKDGIGEFPFNIGVADFILILSNMGRPSDNNQRNG